MHPTVEPNQQLEDAGALEAEGTESDAMVAAAREGDARLADAEEGLGLDELDRPPYEASAGRSDSAER
jgi:hypothetical protein